MEVYVYGTGCGAGELIDRALPAERVAAFVDSAPSAPAFLGRPVITPEALAARNYDLVIVTTRQAEAVAARCEALGIDAERLLFLKNNFALRDRNRCYERAEALLGRDFLEKLRVSQRLIRAPLWSERETLDARELDNDYVRLKTLEALCRELDGLPGAAAELGVYRGGFARCISALLPDRPLYLFDTFEGFDEGEAAPYGRGFTEAHKNTAAERVLAILPHPERAVLRPGLFPGSAEGLEDERFALVSLDVDLEESTYQGLCWFLPRMVPGGYLLLHDYNNPRLPGARAAVRRWEAAYGRLCAVPLCDVCGTLVIPIQEGK